jgi:DNA-binding GntR family transcriptional regulator
MDTVSTKAVPAADRVYQHVKRAILEQVYVGGDLLTEGDVAEQVGVSRTPVREALLRLESEGLLRLYPKKGALVLPMSARDVDDVLEAREVIDTFAAGRAWAQRAELVRTLEPLLADMREHRKAGDARAVVAADRAFHEAIVAAAGNAVILKWYAALRDRQMCIGTTAMRLSPQRMARAVDEHAGILQALRRGTADRFVALVHAHANGTAAHLRSLR